MAIIITASSIAIILYPFVLKGIESAIDIIKHTNSNCNLLKGV